MARPVLREFLVENSTTVIAERLMKSTNSQARKDLNTGEKIHRALRPVLIVAQCITIMPIYGIMGYDNTQLRYSKYSLRTFLSFVVTSMTAFLAMMTMLLVPLEGINYRIIGDVLFYLTNCLSMTSFFVLAKKWNALMDRWAAVEEYMGDLPPVRVSRAICALTVYIVIVSLFEHYLDLLYNHDHCQPGLKNFYVSTFRQIFYFTEYALWKGLIASVVNVLVTCAWNFTDLFLAAMSIVLSAKFRQFNLELESVVLKEKDLAYWKRIRELYNKLAYLTKLVDKHISFLILISFSNNLYFICLQLLHSITPFQSTPKMVYFYVSFIHLLFRTCLVCLTAADVHDKSKACITVLFSVPSSSYNIEIQRMTMQVAFENLTLTGCNFFSVTRTLMLTIAGTIATYEVVLVQFSNLSQNTEEPTHLYNCTEEI